MSVLRRPARPENAGGGLRRVDGVLYLLPGGFLLRGLLRFSTDAPVVDEINPGLYGLTDLRLAVGGNSADMTESVSERQITARFILVLGGCRSRAGENGEAREPASDDKNFAHFHFPSSICSSCIVGLRHRSTRKLDART